MVTDVKYGIIEPDLTLESEFPPITLREVPDRGVDLVVAVFGPEKNYRQNLNMMQRNFSCLPRYPKITFRSATSAESISAAVHDFKHLAKPQIFDPRYLQIDYVSAPEGVFANTKETDKSTLISLLGKCTKVNGIYLYQGDDPQLRDFGVAPYETFEQGVQDCDTFARSGLARVLEHTEKDVANSFKEIASPRFYKRGVNVFGFDEVKKPIQKVAALLFYRRVGSGMLFVDGYGWNDDYGGFAFGVLKKSAEGASQN